MPLSRIHLCSIDDKYLSRQGYIGSAIVQISSLRQGTNLCNLSQSDILSYLLSDQNFLDSTSFFKPLNTSYGTSMLDTSYGTSVLDSSYGTSVLDTY